MTQKKLSIIYISIVALILISVNSEGILLPRLSQKLEPIIPLYGMDVVDLSYEDALYNGTTIQYPLEWYYFDTVLSEGFSVEFHIICGPTDDIGVVTPMVNIYKDGEMIFHDAQYHYINKFDASDDSLTIWFDNQPLIEGKINDDDQWDLFLNYSVENISISLEFTSISQPWKAKVLDMWWWAVLIPNSEVNGTISIENQITEVKGNGYVEHAWEGKIPSVWGWFWGKFLGNNVSIIWSEIFENPLKRHLVMVLNEFEGNYLNIPHEDISITFHDFHLNDGWLIPYLFVFKVRNEHMKLDLTANANYIIHQTSIVSFNYWRYHVHITGSIEYNGTVEHIDNIQIMDLTRFY